MNVKRKNAGNTLFVVIVLLVLASMMSLYALKVGMFEQRTSGNDLRAKLVNEVAEAGLAHGMEYLRQNSEVLKDATNGKWEKCGASTDFPCGSILQKSTVKVTHADGTSELKEVDRRATMYYWKAEGFDFDGSGGKSGWEERMLPLTNTMSSINGFPATYGVGAVLCRVAYKTSSEEPTLCTDDPAKASPTSVVTLVSVGALTSEGARSTLTQTVGSYNILNNPPGKPPIIASGSVDITGGLQIVTNPNAGGPGVPVSVWTRKDMKKTGTPNTCYFDEFLRFGAKNNEPPKFEGVSNIITCDTCSCPAEHSLSYQSSGNSQQEGIDILDVDGSGINHDVKPEEFPCDLFEQVFAVKAWEDKDEVKDHFCETKLMTTYKNPNTGVPVSMGADEAFLYTNARMIYTSSADAMALRRPDQVPTPVYPSTEMSGLVWCQSNCDIGSNKSVGSPDHPVMLVIDGAAKIQGRVFGLVFMRSTGSTLSPGTGGDATLDMNAGAAVYGSVIVQGQIDKANGGASIIYNSDVLTNLANDPTNDKFGGVPGGWADDRVSY